MIGGYSAVAGELNKRFRPQPPIDRRQVYNWDHRQTRNASGELPPSPAEVRPDARRTTPSRVFAVEGWVVWFAEGVPGPRRSGWRRWVEISSQPGMKV